MASMTMTRAVEGVGQPISLSKEYTGSLALDLDETIAGSSTDAVVNIAIDVSAVKAFHISVDGTCTIETNDGTTPDDTLSMTDGDPYEWNEDSLDSFRLGTDVTQLYVTVPGGTDVNIKIRAVVDATP